MSNNEDKRLTKPEYFDLRERRLKLVYKILYVVVAIWIAIFLNLSQSNLKTNEIPIYSFALAASSMVIIQIFKYTIMEFRCMKIVGQLSDELIKQTELRYDNIWKSFSLILALCGLAFITHFKFVEKISVQAFLYIFLGCMVYFTVISFVKIFKRDFNDITIKNVDVIGIIIGSIAAYSLCAAACLITSAI